MYRGQLAGSRTGRLQGWLANVILWCAWVVGTTAGWLLGSLLVWAIIHSAHGTMYRFLDGIVGSALVGALVGLTIGTAQWLMLRKQLPGIGWWIAASAVSWCVGYGVGQGVSGLLRPYWHIRFALGGLLFASAIGLSQWLVLRQHRRRAGWWVLASTCGWAMAGVLSTFSGVDVAASFPIGFYPLLGVLGWILAATVGAMGGAITGVTFVWLVEATPAPAGPLDARKLW